MKVTLISKTPDAERLLIFTKRTRLTMSPGALAEIAAMSPEDIVSELAYMAETIPSSWEFVDYTFLVEGVSRAYTHQQVRTRAASYAQQTMRVNDMADFDYIPTAAFCDVTPKARAGARVLEGVLNTIRSGHRTLLQMGFAPEDARGILPTNISTNIVCKFNLRTLSELCASRTGGRTQDEYQTVINAMADAVLAVHPWAERFLFPRERDYFAEIEAFAAREYGGDLLKKGELLKIVDKMRKAK